MLSAALFTSCGFCRQYNNNNIIIKIQFISIIYLYCFLVHNVIDKNLINLTEQFYY